MLKERAPSLPAKPSGAFQSNASLLRACFPTLEIDPAFVETIRHPNTWNRVLHTLAIAFPPRLLISSTTRSASCFADAWFTTTDAPCVATLSRCQRRFPLTLPLLSQLFHLVFRFSFVFLSLIRLTREVVGQDGRTRRSGHRRQVWLVVR